MKTVAVLILAVGFTILTLQSAPPQSARAASSSWDLRLRGSQENPPVLDDPAGGVVHLAFDDATRTLTYWISVWGISGELVNGAHIHAAPAPLGINTAPKYELLAKGKTYASSTVTISAADASSLLAGDMYVSLRTSAHPAGAARAQIASTINATREVRQSLAPTGRLRVALQVANPLNLTQTSASGELTGVGLDLGRELARRLDVPFEPVLYPSVGALLDSGKTGAWDVGFVGFSPARAEEWDFTALHLQVEFGYLVPAGSAISSITDVDRPGIRIAVQQNSGPDAFFTRTLKDTSVVRAPSNPGALEAVRSGAADVMASIKPVLFELSSQLSGSRVLDGRPGLDPHAMVLPKGRDTGMAYARQFIEDAKSKGLIEAVIKRAGVQGVFVAPLE